MTSDQPPRPPSILAKNLAHVEIILADGTRLEGQLFVGRDERVQDLLNDAKHFLPMKLQDQSVLLLNKASIAICRPLDY